MSARGRDLPLLLLLAIVVAAGFVGGALHRSGGHPFFPLDDAFIFLQAAKQTSHLHFLEYFPGQGYQTGDSSPLWTLLEVPGFWVGLKGIRIILWVWALSGALWLLAVGLMYRLGEAMADRATGLLAALLFLAHGHLAWARWNGMETGLYSTEMLLAVWGMHRWASRRAERQPAGASPWLAWLAAAAMGVTRPEGLGLAAVAALLVSWRARRRETGLLQALGWWLALAPGLLMLALNRLLTGWWDTNALVLKGIFNDPLWTFGEKLHAVAQNWADFWYGMNGGSGDVVWFFRGGAAPWIGPLMLALAFVGAGAGIPGLAQRGQGQGLGLAALWCVLGIAAVCTSAVAFAHLGRYFVAYLPLLVLLAAVGTSELARLWRSRGVHVQTILGTALVALIAPSLLWWGQTYAENCQDIYEQHRRMSWWLNDRGQVPPGTRVGLTDVGALTYFTDGLELCDIVGLTTNRLAAGLPRQATVARTGLGSLWENFERTDRRPDIIITYPTLWTPPHQPRLWLGQPLAAVALADPSITQGLVLTAYRVDWSGANTGDAPPADLVALPGLRETPAAEGPQTMVVDTVDVADLVSEAEHAHTWWHADERPAHRYSDWPPRFNPLRWQARAAGPSDEIVWDGGRAMSGGEAFTLVVQPNRPLRLIGRCDGEEAAHLLIQLGEGPQRPIEVPEGTGWVEFHLDFPAAEVPAAEVRVQVRCDWLHSGQSLWRSYHWWAVQGT